MPLSVSDNIILMKQYFILSALALATSLPLSAQTVLTDADLTDAYHTKTVTGRISVHDPSIVADGNNYYIYGSHLGHAKTTAAENYQTWTTWGEGEATGTTGSLFANASGSLINYADAYSSQAYTGKVKNYAGEEVDFVRCDAHGWQYKGYTVQGNQWAPDVIYNKTMKKWCMYMSLNGDKWCSSIVLFTSDSAEGPWVYQGPVVFSGFQGTYEHNSYSATDDWKHTDLAIATGATSLPERYSVGDKWGSYWPNCIDPCVFYDDDNNLWMSYGSWSGGIFLLKLDASTGLRDYTYTFDYEVNGTKTKPGAANANCTSDPYFGKKIAGGYYVSGEGSYIKKIGNYWFLFLSYGGLNPSQGYQMRIFRSDKATGPYVDANGTSAVYSKYALNYGSSATDDRGVMLMNGYQWPTMSVGEVAQGHNSVFTDAKGRTFVVYHTKFNDGTFGHQVRIHQLFLNEDGWLVAAPYEFDGGTTTNDSIATKASVANADIAGTYQLIRHYYRQSFASVNNGATTATLQTPVNITLSSDGNVSGSGVSGTWKRTAGTDYVTLTIDGTDYKGVLFHQTVDYTDMPSLNISAVADGANPSVEIWASKVDAKAAIKYTLDHLTVPFSDGSVISESSLTLPDKGNLGTAISWESSDASVIDPDFGDVFKDGTVTLTMSLSKDGYVYKKTYNLTVNKTTGIKGITTDEKTGSAIYNLAGQRVGSNYHGVVIKNGKKILQK
jgi:beta-xylosidase